MYVGGLVGSGYVLYPHLLRFPYGCSCQVLQVPLPVWVVVWVVVQVWVQVWVRVQVLVGWVVGFGR